MASWIVHLRIADRLLDRIPRLEKTEFVVGNIAPDSGIPNEDWSAYTPSSVISHFKPNDAVPKTIQISLFTARHFSEEQRAGYSPAEFSFFLGYLVHLLTDQLWSSQVAGALQNRFPERWTADKRALIREAKEDWYDLDFLYLKKHPAFRSFVIYENAVGFQNTFMDIFSSNAFDNRRAYIVSFYRQENDRLDREYPYLTEEQMNLFVQDAADQILYRLKQEYGVA